jgi:hypothetical protein
MGNDQSNTSSKKSQSLAKSIDYVAANYILTQNFQDLTNLSDMKYCNDLVILTSNIISKKLNNLDIQYLAQRLKGGEEINVMTKDNIMYINKNAVSELDVKNPTQKRRLCIGISKFYIKVAHVFAAIVATIKPVYSFKPSSSDIEQDVDLSEKDNIPANSDVKVKRFNLCSQRIDALLNNSNYDVDNDINVNPQFCDINLNTTSGKTRNLGDEPGIQELEHLYFDKYDYDQGGFTGMTEKMRKEVYEKDVETFYKTFTGVSKIPVDNKGNKLISKFSDIRLKDYHSSKGCEADGNFRMSYKGTLKERLFKKYADHTKKMMQTATENQNKLIAVIDQLFVFSINPLNNKHEVVINPKLNETGLQKIVVDTRNIIVNMYKKCEEDFYIGLEIFEAIVEKQILDTSKAQIKEVESEIENKLTETQPEQVVVPTTEPINGIPNAIQVDAQMTVDAPVDAQVDAQMTVDAPVDAQMTVDAPVDAQMTVDASVDAQMTVDAQVDAPVDAQMNVDAPVDAPLDASVDVPDFPNKLSNV